MLGLPLRSHRISRLVLLKAALDLYRARLKPSANWKRPAVMVAANVGRRRGGRTDARRLFTFSTDVLLRSSRQYGRFTQPVDASQRVAQRKRR